MHCLSSSGQPRPGELSTAEAKSVLDELRELQVFYINIGGGEPMIRRDFFELVDYAVGSGIGVKFSTNGAFIDAAKARRLAEMDYLDIQISLDGLDATTNDAVRGQGSYALARRAMDHLAVRRVRAVQDLASSSPGTTSTSSTGSRRWPTRYGAQLRVTRLRPSGRGVDSWPDLHPTGAQQHQLYRWLLAHGDDVLTGDSFFHLNALGEPLPGLNMCGAGRVVCLIDPVGDVYACPFVIHDEFKAGNVRDPGRVRRGVASRARCSRRSASRSRRARAPAAAATTPARAAAWRPSSSPACPSTAPTPSACAGSAPSCWGPTARAPSHAPVSTAPSPSPSFGGRSRPVSASASAGS